MEAECRACRGVAREDERLFPQEEMKCGFGAEIRAEILFFHCGESNSRL